MSTGLIHGRGFHRCSLDYKNLMSIIILINRLANTSACRSRPRAMSGNFKRKYGMKKFISIILFSTFNLLVFSQVKPGTTDKSSSALPDSLFGLKIEKVYSFDSTKNSSFGNYLIKSHSKGFVKQIKGLNEEPLYQSKSNKDKYLLRILSWPSFFNPICFTILKRGENYYLSWKIGRSTGGYEPKGIKKRGKVKIPVSNWFYFLNLIKYKSLDSLPLISFIPMNDGTSWVIENNLDNNYRINFTNIPSTSMLDGFAFLLHLTKYKIKYESDFENRFFDKSNKLINLDTLTRLIINHLNTNLSRDVINSGFSFDSGILISINSRDKVSSVKYMPEGYFRSLSDRFEYIAANFVDRKPRGEVKKVLRKLDLSYLNLSEKIVIPVNCKLNRLSYLLEIDR
jgi:hypothetical protein